MDSLFDQLGETEERTVFGRVPARAIDRTPLPVAAADPSPSRIAAVAQVRSGRLRGHALAVLELVRAYPGSTFRELHQRQTTSSMSAEEVMRRLNTLVLAGLVEKPDERKDRTCEVSGRVVTTWWPVAG